MAGLSCEELSFFFPLYPEKNIWFLKQWALLKHPASLLEHEVIWFKDTPSCIKSVIYTTLW